MGIVYFFAADALLVARVELPVALRRLCTALERSAS